MNFMSEKLKPLKWYKNLSTKKHRDKEGCFFVESDKKIQQILLRVPDAVLEIVGTEDLVAKYEKDFEVRCVTKNQFASISRHKSPQGVGAVVKNTTDVDLPSVLTSSEKILFLDDVQDPGNVGTLIRTAAAFDFDGVILSKQCADVFSPKVVDASVGALFSLWLKEVEDISGTLKLLKEEGFLVAVADLTERAENHRLKTSDKTVVVLGSEGQGVGEEAARLADFKVTIAINREKAESLNVASCGAILMHMVGSQK